MLEVARDRGLGATVFRQPCNIAQRRCSKRASLHPEAAAMFHFASACAFSIHHKYWVRSAESEDETPLCAPLTNDEDPFFPDSYSPLKAGQVAPGAAHT